MKAEDQHKSVIYLKATGIEIGLLINFGTPKLRYKRMDGQS
ncbi:MAG TPA: GxxExxY protein [Geobacteraceae bacterium]|nr:GxxExxY protein [Geobacteraceae bacterium]